MTNIPESMVGNTAAEFVAVVPIVVTPREVDSHGGDVAQVSRLHEAALHPKLTTIIERRSGLQIVQWHEIWAYRDLFRFLVWREIKVRYAQSAVGIGWAVIQPLFTMLIFSIVFGRLAQVASDGAPYVLFSLTALVPWMFFANALTDGVNSLIVNAGMLRKIYFPRMLMPLSAVAARILDFGFASLVLFAFLAWYRIVPGWNVTVVPLLMLLMVLTASGIALWLTALAIQYRDVKHAMNYVVQILMYAAPVVYPASLIPQKYQMIYAINPMVGVIEGFRASLLGIQPMPWGFLTIGASSATLIAVSGLYYFRNKERLFADVA